MRNFCGSTKEQLNCKAHIMGIHMTERIAYTVKEAAAALGVSEWMVREELSRKTLFSVKMGARLLIPRWALEERLGIPSFQGEPSHTDS